MMRDATRGVKAEIQQQQGLVYVPDLPLKFYYTKKKDYHHIKMSAHAWSIKCR
jgi:hypothetical protein